MGRVSSLQDLLARCTVASERKLSKSSIIAPEEIVLELGLPPPGDATNADLNNLLPLYTALLRDIEEKSSSSPFLEILQTSTRKSPDAAILLLNFIEYPIQVRMVRADTSDLSKSSVKESFECADLVNDIAECKIVVKWCRDALFSSENHHSVVLASCIAILHSICLLPKPKKPLKKSVLQANGASEEEIIKQWHLFRTALAKVARRDDVTRDAAVMAILFQMHILSAFFDEDKAISVMTNAPGIESFEKGLAKHRGSFTPAQYQMFRTLVGSNVTQEDLLAGAQVFRKTGQKDFVKCSNDGCDKEGKSRCIKCKVATYCGKDCQVADWKKRHKKDCKKLRESSPATLSDEAMAAARAHSSPALQRQEQFLRLNPNIDYRIVLPTGSQDVGVIFPHPMGKMMFKMWRSKAPEAPFVYRMYEMIVESQPNHKKLIRNQLRAEYGVDPLSDEAKNTPAGATPFPTGQQIVDSHSPNMIFYPEVPMKQRESPSGASVRGTVGHEPMFMTPMLIYEDRIQKLWRSSSENNGGKLFGEHTQILLALLDIGSAMNLNEESRAESVTLRDSEAVMRSQLNDLERRVRDTRHGGKGNDSFLYVSLEQFYYTLPHAKIEMMVKMYFQNQSADLIDKILSGYKNVQVYTHRQGPHPSDGSRPLDKDLIGPHPFKCGLRLHCGMTTTIAILHILGLLQCSKSKEVSEAFVFPHALVFATNLGSKRFEEIIKGLGVFGSGIYEESSNTWFMTGQECVVNVHGNAIRHVGSETFLDNLRKEGCSLYPVFSDNQLKPNFLY